MNARIVRQGGLNADILQAAIIRLPFFEGNAYLIE
jgi:hypothetical protein